MTAGPAPSCGQTGERAGPNRSIQAAFGTGAIGPAGIMCPGGLPDPNGNNFPIYKIGLGKF
jgi:hypothetical protein